MELQSHYTYALIFLALALTSWCKSAIIIQCLELKVIWERYNLIYKSFWLLSKILDVKKINLRKQSAYCTTANGHFIQELLFVILKLIDQSKVKTETITFQFSLPSQQTCSFTCLISSHVPGKRQTKTKLNWSVIVSHF